MYFYRVLKAIKSFVKHSCRTCWESFTTLMYKIIAVIRGNIQTLIKVHFSAIVNSRGVHYAVVINTGAV